ncbi:pentatricopeptide repeat-containing protein [Pyrus ussuriensis x Pyrus communis]|uniref:Pentatricopeptide repeat-containing protein n=1 Tax=Pyrus ussuriensis x Pyrus communis TaxID=2448454 RepID=A0A5N5GFL2_9ROSA|nr:pentatricopeptide repeat-containing protein [Pyrus ussuriensis x Pyrus communis]
MLKMMRATVAASSSSLKVGYGNTTSRLRLRGMRPCLLQSSTAAVFFNNYLALFHSPSSKSTESRNTQQHQLVKITNVEDALNVFDEMLQICTPSVLQGC